MKEHEKASGVKPTRLKTAICADLITKLCYGLERYTPVRVLLMYSIIAFNTRPFVDNGAFNLGIIQQYL
jgi:hypothetical protein